MKLTKRTIATGKFFVGLKGGEIACYHGEEEQWRIGLMAGMHFADSYRSYMADHTHLRLFGAVQLVKPGGSRVNPNPYGRGSTESGANPDFQPTRATEFEMEMRKKMEQLTRKSNAVEKRMKNLMRFEEQIKRPAHQQEEKDDEKVIETQPDAEKQEKDAQDEQKAEPPATAAE